MRAKTCYNETVKWFLIASGLLLTSGPLFCLIWSVLPPPRYGFWITGLLAGEWALWLGAFAVLGAGFGVLVLRIGYGRGVGVCILCLGIVALILAFMPYFQTLPVARKNHVVLSFARYFSRLPQRETGKPDAAEEYAAPNGVPLLLDVYLPRKREAEAKRPAVLVIHGGSWNAGNRSDFPQWSRFLADNGFVVFDIDYRLGGQPNFKTAPGDVKAAVLWVKRNAQKFGVDKNRVALLGRSAGAQLALLAAYAPDDARLPASSGSGGDASVQAVVSLYGPADLEWGYAHPAPFDIIRGPEKLRAYLGGRPETVPENYALASPIRRVSAQSPPTLLIHGLRDTIVGPVHSERLSARLDTFNVPHQSVYFPYATHGFDYPFNGWGSQVTQNVLLNFLHKHL